MKPTIIFLMSLALGIDVHAQGRTAWNEGVNGSLGSTAASATYLGFLRIGTNTLLGSTEVERTGSGWLTHEDYFLFDVSPSLQISSIALTIDKQNVWTWIGSSNFGTEIGFQLNSVTGNLLPQFSLQSLAPGNYGMYVANHDLQPFTSIANYELSFVLTPVPEPSTWALLGLGSALLWSAARRHRT